MSTLCVADDANCRVRLELRAERGPAEKERRFSRLLALVSPGHDAVSSHLPTNVF